MVKVTEDLVKDIAIKELKETMEMVLAVGNTYDLREICAKIYNKLIPVYKFIEGVEVNG